MTGQYCNLHFRNCGNACDEQVSSCHCTQESDARTKADLYNCTHDARLPCSVMLTQILAILVVYTGTTVQQNSCNAMCVEDTPHLLQNYVGSKHYNVKLLKRLCKDQ